MNKITVHMPTQDAHTKSDVRMMAVSLPAPPFDLPATDRSETKPHPLAIRTEMTAARREWLRGMMKYRNK